MVSPMLRWSTDGHLTTAAASTKFTFLDPPIKYGYNGQSYFEFH